MPVTLGRNEPCHCGSGKKYKKCHLESDEKTDRKEREKAALNMAKVAEAAAKEDEKEHGHDKTGAHAPQEKPGGFFSKVAGKVNVFRSSQRRTPNKGG
jgi:hypothetical protein